MLPLLARVPVLPCLMMRQLSQDRQQGVISLLDWISAQVRVATNNNNNNNNKKPGLQIETFSESFSFDLFSNSFSQNSNSKKNMWWTNNLKLSHCLVHKLSQWTILERWEG